MKVKFLLLVVCMNLLSTLAFAECEDDCGAEFDVNIANCAQDSQDCNDENISNGTDVDCSRIYARCTIAADQSYARCLRSCSR